MDYTLYRAIADSILYLPIPCYMCLYRSNLYPVLYMTPAL